MAVTHIGRKRERFHRGWRGLVASALLAACAPEPKTMDKPDPYEEPEPTRKQDGPSAPKADAAVSSTPDAPPPVDTGSGLLADAPRGDTSSGDGPPASGKSLLDDPLGPLPQSIKDLGLYTALPDYKKVVAKALFFRPTWELWSNGLGKERHTILPAGKKVDTTDRGKWEFPVGTLFFKTFTFKDPMQGGRERPVETRLIRRTATEWEFAVWQWNAQSTDAQLADIQRGIRTAVTVDGQNFEHRIPARQDCRACHESNATAIIGFDELRLNSKLDGKPKTQLQEVAEAGWLSGGMPTMPDEIVDPDPATKAIRGYVHGNCAHCHNGLSIMPPRSFDMRHRVFVKNTVGVMTMTSGTASGMRIMKGDPSKSILYLAVWGQSGNTEVKDMPPLGVERRDKAFIDALAKWITNLK